MSYGPKMLVGIAEVKLQPNSSWYALHDTRGRRSQLSALQRRARGGTVFPRRKGMTQLVVDVDETLAVGVAKVGRVRRAEVDGRLVDRVRDLVREHAGRQARDDLFDLQIVAHDQSVGDRKNMPDERGAEASETEERTLCSFAAHMTLSLMRQLSRRNVSLYFMFLKSPPTSAARWMT